jgi:hypothetical protein
MKTVTARMAKSNIPTHFVCFAMAVRPSIMHHNVRPRTGLVETRSRADIVLRSEQ